MWHDITQVTFANCAPLTKCITKTNGTFDVDIANNDVYRSFSYKAKLLGNTVADGENGISKNTIIAIPLKYLSNRDHLKN